MSGASVDERGRVAAAAVNDEVRAWLARADSADLRTREAQPAAVQSRTPRRVAVAACTLLVVALLGVILVIDDDRGPGVVASSSDPAREPPYSFVPTSLPKGMRPVAYVSDPSTRSSSIDPTDSLAASPPVSVTYARNYGDVPSFTVGTSRERRGGLNGKVTQAQVRGQRATIGGFADRSLGPVYSLRWKEGGKYFSVGSTGLSRSELVEVAQHLRPVTALQLMQRVRDVPMWPFSVGSRSEPVAPLPIATLVSIPRPDDMPIELTLEHRVGADERTWLCATATRMGASSTGCADPTFGFTVPLLLDATLTDVAVEDPRVDPRQHFVVMSVRPSQTLSVELPDGTVLPARTYDTGEGRRPVLAFVDLGAGIGVPEGAVTLRGRDGDVVERWRLDAPR